MSLPKYLGFSSSPLRERILRSRVPFSFTFNDYTCDELTKSDLQNGPLGGRWDDFQPPKKWGVLLLARSVFGFHLLDLVKEYVIQPLYMGVSKNNGKTPQIIPCLIGFSIIFTIHFGVPQFLETPICQF